jgi:hypothetical protein
MAEAKGFVASRFITSPGTAATAIILPRIIEVVRKNLSKTGTRHLTLRNYRVWGGV